MKKILLQTEALDLLAILNRTPVEKIAEKGKNKYKALTLKRYIKKELEEKNKEWIEKEKEAREITDKIIKDLEVFRKEVNSDDPKDLSPEQEKEKKDTIEEATKEAFSQINKKHKKIGVKALMYQNAGIARYEYLNETDDKEIEIELLEDDDKNQVAFVKDIIERVALEVYPLEIQVLALGEKFEV